MKIQGSFLAFLMDCCLFWRGEPGSRIYDMVLLLAKNLKSGRKKHPSCLDTYNKLCSYQKERPFLGSFLGEAAVQRWGHKIASKTWANQDSTGIMAKFHYNESTRLLGRIISFTIFARRDHSSIVIMVWVPSFLLFPWIAVIYGSSHL